MKYIKFILLFLFFVSCQESKNKDNIKKNESKKVTKEYDFSDSMKFKYEDITSVEVYSFLNKAMVEMYKIIERILILIQMFKYQMIL